MAKRNKDKKKPSPSLLGSGMAMFAGSVLKNRQTQLKKQEKKATGRKR